MKIESISAEEEPLLDGIIKAETAPGETAPGETERAAAEAAAANVDVLGKAAAIKKAEVMSKIKKIEALIEENPELREVIEGFMAVDEMKEEVIKGLIAVHESTVRFSVEVIRGIINSLPALSISYETHKKATM